MDVHMYRSRSSPIRPQRLLCIFFWQKHFSTIGQLYKTVFPIGDFRILVYRVNNYCKEANGFG